MDAIPLIIAFTPVLGLIVFKLIDIKDLLKEISAKMDRK